MDIRAKQEPSPSEVARAHRTYRLAPGQRRSHWRDIGLGVTCGIIAAGIAAGVWLGGVRHDAEGAQPSTGTTSLRDQSNGKVITVTVTTWGSLRSILGGAAAQVSIPEGSTVADLSEHLADVYPALAPAAMLAVNDESEMLPLNQTLNDGQTVTLIGSMAGG